MLFHAPHVRGASYVTYLATLATLVGFLVAGTLIYRTSLRQGTNCLGSKVATTGTGGACNGVDKAEVVVEASKVFALTSANGPRCDASGACTGGACFAAGTPVLTPSGERPIEAIVAGDLVLSKDVVSGEVAAREVVATKVTYGKPALLLELEAESGHREVLTVTPNHPFFVEGRGFLAAERLSSDDRVTTPTGRARVLGIAESATSEPVYNFEVASFHTYFVGKTHALVHNDCDGAAWQAPYEERDAANVLAIARKYAELNQAFEALAKTKPGTPESIAAGDKARRLAIELQNARGPSMADVDIALAQILSSPRSSPAAKKLVAQALTDGTHAPGRIERVDPSGLAVRMLTPAGIAQQDYRAFAGLTLRQAMAAYAAQEGTPEMKAKALALLTSAQSPFHPDQAYAIFGAKVQAHLKRVMASDKDTPWKDVGKFLQIKELAKDPKWAEQIQLERLDEKLAAAWKHPDVLRDLTAFHKETLQQVRLSDNFAKQVDMLRSDDFLLRLELEGPEQAKKTLELEIAKVAAIDAALADTLLNELVARQLIRDFHSLTEDERAAAYAKALDQYFAELAKNDVSYADVTKNGLKVPADVMKRLAAVAKAQQSVLAANRAAQAYEAYRHIIDESVKAGKITPHQATRLAQVFISAEKVGIISSAAATLGLAAVALEARDGSLFKSNDKLVAAAATILKSAGSADAYAKLGAAIRGLKLADNSNFAKATKFGKFLRVAKFAGPIGDALSGVLDAKSAYSNYKKGHTTEAVLDASAAGAATALVLSGIAIASGSTGPAAPLVMLVGTVGYFGIKGVKWLVADPDELKLIKEAQVYRDIRGSVMQARQDAEIRKYAGSLTSDRRNTPGPVGARARDLLDGNKQRDADLREWMKPEAERRKDLFEYLDKKVAEVGARVDAAYLRVLGRGADAPGRTVHIGLLQSGATDTQLREALAKSKEGQDIITKAWKDKLGREPTADERAQATLILRELGKSAVERAPTDMRGALLEADNVAKHGLGFYAGWQKQPGSCSKCH